jgi:hypothetical protein
MSCLLFLMIPARQKVATMQLFDETSENGVENLSLDLEGTRDAGRQC